MTFDWNLAKTFLATVDEGSLSAAARVLGQTQPTVSRQIAALEDALGVTLFERTARSVVLTQSGMELLDHVRTMADGANMVSLSASGQSQSIAGQVRITASELTSAYLLPPIIADLRKRAPALDIDLIADSGVKDLVRREADIAIRHVRPDQPNLVMKRLRDDQMNFYASPAYLAEYGEPTPAKMAGHQIISFVDADQMLGYLSPTALDVTRDNFRLTTSSLLVATHMALDGLGMIVAPQWITQTHPRLQQILAEIPPFRVPTWLVTHSELNTSRRIRLVFDHISDHL